MNARYAFKVLCSGEVIDEVIRIANDTTDVTFNKGETYFPNTKLHVVVCRSYCRTELFNLILKLMQIILERAECLRHQKRRSQHVDQHKGTCVFYAAISDKMASSLIGPGGSSIENIKNTYDIKSTENLITKFTTSRKQLHLRCSRS